MGYSLKSMNFKFSKRHMAMKKELLGGLNFYKLLKCLSPQKD